MINHDLLEKMLELPEFEIYDLQHNEHDIRIYVNKRIKPDTCPNCGVCEPKLRVHGRRIQEVRDKNILNKRVGLMFNRARYLCLECETTFYELSDSIPPKSRMTSRLRRYIAEQSKRRSFSELEAELDISNVTIREIFLEEARKLKGGLFIETPSIIGIDEIHIQREGKHRKQAWCLICSGDNNTVIDMLPNRNKSTVTEYFANLASPYNVNLVTMDMWEPYRDSVYASLPNAKVVIDKFHVVKMANDALNRMRKKLKGDITKVKNKSLKKERYLLLKREHDLRPLPDIVLRDAWFSEFPALRTAYNLKEELFKIYDCRTKYEAVNRFYAWKNSIPKDFHEFVEVANTIQNWEKEIFNYFDHRITNAFVEGINSTIRAIEKQGRGYSFEVLRAKVMFYINHKIEKPKPSYASNTFSNMMLMGRNEFRTISYGVPLKNIVTAINEGKL
jgi:transposase